MSLEARLYQHFQHNTFRKGQKEIITSILKGQNTLGMLPTGTGKSLCYQLPGYYLEGIVLIVSPLISLMQDQVEQMKMRGEKRVVAFNSFLSKDAKRHAFQMLPNYKFIFVSPEMLTTPFFMKQLKKLNIALFVIDEAHCISQWGFDFRPDYSKLGWVRKELANPLTLALTATATEQVRKDIITSLNIKNAYQFISSVDRENISLTVEILNQHENKLNRLLEIVTKMNSTGIIYFSSKKLADFTAQFLRNNGINKVMSYHGGMDQENRNLVQQQFIYNQLDIICATSAFGMGVNKDNIRFIVHFHLPMQIESYLQEIGRAGRDGNPSVAILLYSPGDEELPLQLAEHELPTQQQIRVFANWYVGRNRELKSISLAEITDLFGFTEIQWRVIVNLMENISTLDKVSIEQELTKFAEERLIEKYRRIQWMKDWILAKGCRRKKVLAYFDEQITSNQTNCCDQCGFLMDHSIMKNNKIQMDELSYNWKQDLATILLNE